VSLAALVRSHVLRLENLPTSVALLHPLAGDEGILAAGLLAGLPQGRLVWKQVFISLE